MLHSAGDAPSLLSPSLADAAADVVDQSSLAFLLKASLRQRRKEEEEDARKVEMEQVLAVKEQWRARRKVLKDEFLALLDLKSRSSLQERRLQELLDALDAHDASKPSSGSSKRKKKRKRRKLPKAPLPRSGAVLGQGRCARVVQRQSCGQTVQKAVLVLQLQFFGVRLPPFVPQRLIPMVLPVQYHTDSAVAVGQVVDAPVPCPLSFRQVLMVQALQKTVEVRLRMLPYSLHCLVRNGYMYCVSYGSGLTLFLRPLVSDSYLFALSPEEYTIWIFWEMTSRYFRIQLRLVRQCTCSCQFTEVLANFTPFLREGGSRMQKSPFALGNLDIIVSLLYLTVCSMRLLEEFTVFSWRDGGLGC